MKLSPGETSFMKDLFSEMPNITPFTRVSFYFNETRTVNSLVKKGLLVKDGEEVTATDAAFEWWNSLKS